MYIYSSTWVNMVSMYLLFYVQYYVCLTTKIVSDMHLPSLVCAHRYIFILSIVHLPNLVQKQIPRGRPKSSGCE